MAGHGSYFSNHSQSRFLANSQASTTSGTTATTTTTTTTTATAQTNNTPAPRPNRVPSRHFSTSVSNNGTDEKSLHTKEKSGGSVVSTNGGTAGTVHPLRNTWNFWFRQHRAPGNKIVNYEEGIKKVSAFSSVESFWSLWTHLNPPSTLLPTTDYLLFHNGIRRPVWEDPLNLSGGKWIIRLKKGVSDRLWEDLVLAIIGEQFDCCVPEKDGDTTDGSEGTKGGKFPRRTIQQQQAPQIPAGDWPEICGCTISVRQNEDIISVWNRTDSDPKVKEKIGSTIRRVLNLPSNTNMEYKSNNDSMQDKSSFRVPGNDRTPLA